MINECNHYNALGPPNFKSLAITPSTPGALLLLKERSAAATSASDEGLVDIAGIGV
jgi:hypothetical protein